jgi:hypothetical protein
VVDNPSLTMLRRKDKGGGGPQPALSVRHQYQARGRRGGRRWWCEEEGWLRTLTVLLRLPLRGGVVRQVNHAATPGIGGGGGVAVRWLVETSQSRRRGGELLTNGG